MGEKEGEKEGKGGGRQIAMCQGTVRTAITARARARSLSLSLSLSERGMFADTVRSKDSRKN